MKRSKVNCSITKDLSYKRTSKKLNRTKNFNQHVIDDVNHNKLHQPTCQKCEGMGLNGFVFKKIIKNDAENMKKIVGAV